MPGATRLGELASGHGCYPSHPSIEASNKVFVEGIGIVRQGDAYAPHTCDGSTHSGVLASGSSKVYVEGKQAGRIGDPVSCGSTVSQGSSKVFIGG